MDVQDQVDRAATPDPDAPDCEWCGGGLDHFPECPVEVARAERQWLSRAQEGLLV